MFFFRYLSASEAVWYSQKQNHSNFLARGHVPTLDCLVHTISQCCHRSNRHNDEVRPMQVTILRHINPRRANNPFSVQDSAIKRARVRIMRILRTRSLPRDLVETHRSTFALFPFSSEAALTFVRGDECCTHGTYAGVTISGTPCPSQVFKVSQ